VVYKGHVGGTFTSGARDDPWNVPGSSDFLKISYEDYENGTFELDTNYSSDIGEAFLSVLNLIVKWGAGSILGGPAGLFIFVGVEVGSLIATGSLVPGARVLSGLLFMAGPSNTLLAIAAAGITAAGSRQRHLSQEEYDWAKKKVFAESLPPIQDIILTDTIGAGDRAFTFAAPLGKITLNIGLEAFDDPRTYHTTKGRQYSETFIRELTYV
jgi:hypothetical protein